MGTVKFDSIEKDKSIQFCYFEKRHFKNIQVGCNNDYIYQLNDLEQVHLELVEFLPLDVQALYDNYELQSLMTEFPEECLWALSDMMEERGVEKYGLKIYQNDRFEFIKE